MSCVFRKAVILSDVFMGSSFQTLGAVTEFIPDPRGSDRVHSRP